MTNADQAHFESYRAQTQIKHLILESYLRPYFDIVKEWTTSLIYIDAFAGRGCYKNQRGDAEEFPGSPLRAIRLFGTKPEFKSIKTVLIEKDQNHCEQLRRNVDQAQTKIPHAVSTEIYNDRFSVVGPQVLAHLRKSHESPAVFLFVDPCGVEDVQFNIIMDVLKMAFCEAFLFFNYEGINRIVGAAELSGRSTTLINLFGSEYAVGALLAAVSQTTNAAERERAIVNAYCDLIKEAVPLDFIAPFRIEHENRLATSHYLLHATKNRTAFRIMKDIMWERSKGSGTSDGQLEFLQRTDTSDGLFLREDLAAQERTVLNALSQRAHTVEEIVKLAERPTDFFSGASYKQCLKRLERERKISVFEADGRTPRPASIRPKMRNSDDPTLANHLVVKVQ